MTKDNYTHLALIVDRSGSMYGIHTDMNKAIQKLLDEQGKEEGTVLVDVATFDHEVEYPYESCTPGSITGDLIEPRGSTALNDAIGVTIQRLGRKFALMREDERPSNVIVVVVTDGGENSSREYTHEQVKKLVEQQTNEWNWTFMYLAANVDAFATGSTYGFTQANSMNYLATASGGSNAYAAASANITRVRQGRDAGFTEEEREAATTQ